MFVRYGHAACFGLPVGIVFRRSIRIEQLVFPRELPCRIEVRRGAAGQVSVFAFEHLQRFIRIHQIHLPGEGTEAERVPERNSRAALCSFLVVITITPLEPLEP